MRTLTQDNWQELTLELAQLFAERAADHDREAAFVQDNYDVLKEHGYFSALVPSELGGAGMSHADTCDMLRLIGQHCGSTGLALSMHQHLVAANVWKMLHGKGGEPVLRKVADQQLVLVSTGARDWLESNGEMERTEGGYLVSGQKYFASQSSGGDVLVTSAPYEHPEAGWQVLHFPVPLSADGVTVRQDWVTMGMRGTGSNTVILDRVFVPDSAIALTRERHGFHPVWNVVLTVAMPLIMSVYVGIAERAAEMAIAHCRTPGKAKAYTPSVIGEMHNQLTTAQVMWRDMIRITSNFDFTPENQQAQDILSRKVTVAKACIETVNLAMRLVAGPGFYQGFGLERLFRDVQGAHFHPLPELDQQIFAGDYILKGE